MHSTTLISWAALALTAVALPPPAVDSPFQQLTFSPELDAIVRTGADYLHGAIAKGKEVLHKVKEEVEEGVRSFELVETDGIMRELDLGDGLV